MQDLILAVECIDRVFMSVAMFKITAVIRHYKLEDVKNALVQGGFRGLTVEEVRGFGRQRGHREHYRGTEYTVDFVPKIRLSVVVCEEQLKPALDIIASSARTNAVGDGKIFVKEIADVVRIRTGEMGTEAL